MESLVPEILMATVSFVLGYWWRGVSDWHAEEKQRRKEDEREKQNWKLKED